MVMVNIKVAVRIRPLSHRELMQRDVSIVRKEQKFILVTNPKIPEGQDGDSRQRTRKFAVDFCYDPTEPEGCTQEAVYREIGSEVLDSMFEGYNACVLAYGHSASGKTYTIMGLQDDPGLTPRLCQGLFNKIEEKSSPAGIQFHVFVSFLEIYNEKVRDLLGNEEAGGGPSNFSLRVREHPKLGPYVQGLSQHLVRDKRKLLGLLAAGNRRRSTAATENNIHSSRSHAVFTINFKQSDEENCETEKLSKVHLVDLAGSLQEVSQQNRHDERASAAQSKARLKEGANINKSLVTLGNVISALADTYETGYPLKEHFTSKTWHPFVPYRDSVLTWLLKDTLGGNSHTIMIATVSPASGCLSETINTLRYAKRTKRIVNQPIVNEDPKIRTIRQLKEEISRLRGQLLCLQSDGRRDQFKEKRTPEKLVTPRQDENDDPSEKEEKNRKPKLRIHEVAETKKVNPNNQLVRAPEAASLDGNACEIESYEKESDVNGSVIDNFSHETEFFSDSLESFSSLCLKNEHSIDKENNGRKTVESSDKDRQRFFFSEVSREPKKNLKLCLKREFNSCENLMTKDWAKTLHRSRPDLIRGISTRSKEGVPSTSSRSCTDVSNVSQSASENSLNSSGSMDAHASINRGSPRLRERTVESFEKGGELEGESATKTKNRNEVNELGIKKKDKRSEIVEAVTTRLYVSKKKADHGMESSKKEEDQYDGELEELKLCKRARMKLFDLSRKLAMTKRIKKTVDSNTQTDFVSRTVRVKEKCVVTDESGVNYETNAVPEEKYKTCVVMNHVFIPKSSNYTVECGKVLRIETQEAFNKHEFGTQTLPEYKTYKNANTSPIKFVPQSDDSFSDDSLDLKEKAQLLSPALSETGYKLWEDYHLEESLKSNLSLCRSCSNPIDSKSVRNSDISINGDFGCYSETNIRDVTTNLIEKRKSSLFSNLLTKDNLEKQGISPATPISQNSLSSDSKKEENFSSENSLTSGEGTDGALSSETSSEDFVFYEGPKDKDRGNNAKENIGDRALYTITENSEQSDPSEAFSPLPSKGSSQHALEAVSSLRSQAEDVPNEFHTMTTQETSKGPINTNDTVVKGGRGKYNKLESAPVMSPEVKSLGKVWRLTSNVVQTDVAQSDEVLGSLIERFEFLRSKLRDSSHMPNCSPPSANVVPKNFVKVPNSSVLCFPKTTEVLGNEVKVKRSGTAEGCQPSQRETESNPPKPKLVNWADFQSNSQKHFINLNILNTSKPPPFSVDSHLFRTSRRDKSTDPIFTSADSITFVFMGPAKPKTSVLMEIIRRSLEKRSSSEKGSAFSQERDSRSRGIQCDSNLIRSVSVDTAMIALSQIAKNQDQEGDVFRTSSLDALALDGFQDISDRFDRERGAVESGCQCDLENLRGQTKKSLLKHSVCVGTIQDEQTEIVDVRKRNVQEVEKQKKSVSWSGETKFEMSETEDDSRRSATTDNVSSPHFDLSYCGTPEMEVDEANEKNHIRYFSPCRGSSVHGRRVRFLKSDNLKTEKDKHRNFGSFRHGKRDDSVKSMSTFLKEATQLLRNLNYYSSKHQMFYKESNRECDILQGDLDKETPKSAVKRGSKRPDFLTRSETAGCLENKSGERQKIGTTLGAGNHQEDFQNLTWPRRATPGKPPTGARPRFLRSPLFSRSSSNGFSDPTKSYSQSNRAGPCRAPWNVSDLSVALSHSYLVEPPLQEPTSRSLRFNEYRESRDSSLWSSWFSQRIPSPRPYIADLNFDSLSEMKTDLEESCRRLELMAEQDKIRQEVLENKRKHLDYNKLYPGNRFASDCCDENSWIGSVSSKGEVRDAVKRRKKNECTGNCTCKGGGEETCACFWAKACRSNFELDSYGPGSKHCAQLCLFCRKKEKEQYCSALSLNSECCSNRCRLNYYGYCPCSSVRLNHVSTSPRAYMNHLLTLRRKIVSQTKR